MNRHLLVFLFTLLSSYISNSQNLTSFTAIKLKKLDSIATQDVPKAAPGIATGIIRNGRIIYEKLAGFADLSDSSLITKHTRFNIASNGKQFTALAILMLLDAKKINLSDDIRKYFPGMYNKITDTITIENLLNHSSGIRDVYDLWSLQGLTWWKNSFTNKDVISLLLKQEELNFKPGTYHLYSNSNYIVLAAIIEKASGMSFVKFTNEMFRQLNMPNTSFEEDYTKIKGPIAKAYFNFSTWSTYNWIWNVYGDGNIFSTLADQLQWEKILQGRSNTTIKRIIIRRSQQLTNNARIKNYGYGLEFGTYKGLSYKFHEGATGAWKATVLRFPTKNTSFVTLTNTGKSIPSMQTRQMADIVFNLGNDAAYFVTKPASVGSLVTEEEIIGTYLTNENYSWQFEQREGTLYLKRIGRNDVKLERESANIYHQATDPAFKQEFRKNKKNELEVTAYYTSHAPYTLTKLNSDWENFNYNALEGKFLNTETNTTIELKYISGNSYEIKRANQEIRLGLLISPGKLLLENYILDVEKNNSKIQSFLLQGDRIQRVKFFRAN